MKRVLLLVTIAALASAQSVNVNLRAGTLQGINRLTLNDFNFVGIEGRTKELFGASVTISGITSQSLSLTIRFELVRNGQVLVSGTSNAITNVDNQIITVDNRRLGDQVSIRQRGGSSASLKISTVNIADNVRGIQPQDLMSSFPDGNYIIRLRASLSNGASNTGQVTFQIRRNWQVNLVKPLDGSRIATPYPQFGWSGTNDWFTSVTEYPKLTLYVFENKGKLSESLASVPVLKQDVTRLLGYTFPADNPRQLKPGSEYYWTVRPVIKTAQGIKTLKTGQVFKFKMVESGDTQVEGGMTGWETPLQAFVGPAVQQIKQEVKGFKLMKIRLIKRDGSSSNASVSDLERWARVFNVAKRVLSLNVQVSTN